MKIQVKFINFKRSSYRSDPTEFDVVARVDGGEWQEVGNGEADKVCTYEGLSSSDDRYAIGWYTVSLYTGPTPFVAYQECFDFDSEHEVAVTFYGTAAKAKAALKRELEEAIRQKIETVQEIADELLDALPEVDAEDQNAICENDTCATEWPLKMCGQQCDCGSYVWAKGDTVDPDALPEVDAEDVSSHGGEYLQSALEVVAEQNEELETLREDYIRERIERRKERDSYLEQIEYLEQIGDSYLVLLRETAEDHRLELAGLIAEKEHQADVYADMYRRMGVALQQAELELSRAREEIQMAHDANLSLVAQLESLLPAPPPTPERGGAKDGEDGDRQNQDGVSCG